MSGGLPIAQTRRSGEGWDSQIVLGESGLPVVDLSSLPLAGAGREYERVFADLWILAQLGEPTEVTFKLPPAMMTKMMQRAGYSTCGRSAQRRVRGRSKRP